MKTIKKMKKFCFENPRFLILFRMVIFFFILTINFIKFHIQNAIEILLIEYIDNNIHLVLIILAAHTLRFFSLNLSIFFSLFFVK